MNDEYNRSLMDGPGGMLLSAAILGFFGFTSTFVATSGITGNLLLYVPLLEWTLKGSAVAFVVAAGVTAVKPVGGNLIYGLVGLVGAVLFLVVATMDFLDKQHSVMSPVLLLIFAAWNGYSSWGSLQAVMRRRAAGDAASNSG